MSSLKKQVISGAFFYRNWQVFWNFRFCISVGYSCSIIGSGWFWNGSGCVSICQFFTLVSDFGLAAAIIQDKTLNDINYDDIFSFTVGDCFWSWFYISYPSFLLRVLEVKIWSFAIGHFAFSYCFTTINIVPNALLSKDKRFKFITIRTIVM